MDSRYYPGVEADLPKLIAELRALFDEDYEVQTMHVSSTTVLQARKSSTWKIIEDHIARKGGGYVPPLPGRCGNCGSANTTGAGFCSSCGADIRSSACPSCGAMQTDASARFCNRCGKPLAAASR
jgi:hypothetical protein